MLLMYEGLFSFANKNDGSLLILLLILLILLRLLLMLILYSLFWYSLAFSPNTLISFSNLVLVISNDLTFSINLSPYLSLVINTRLSFYLYSYNNYTSLLLFLFIFSFYLSCRSCLSYSISCCNSYFYFIYFYI